MAPTILMSAFLLLRLFSLGAASAIPTAEKAYPEVIPGEGLPSLAELGLTSAQLYNTELPEHTSKIALRAHVEGCGPEEVAYTDVKDIIACYNYLVAAGPVRFTAISGVPTVFVTCGAGAVAGDPQTEGYASAIASDIATGVLAVINGCTRPDQTVAGEAQGTHMTQTFVIDVGLAKNF